MITVEILEKFETAERFLAENGIAVAESILDSLREHAFVSGTADSLQFLGRLAQGYRRAGKVEKELPVLEKLAPLAVNELKRKGVLATSSEIQATGADVAYLARAYSKIGRIAEANVKFSEANALFSEVGMEIHPDYEKIHPHQVALRRRQ